MHSRFGLASWLPARAPAAAPITVPRVLSPRPATTLRRTPPDPGASNGSDDLRRALLLAGLERDLLDARRSNSR